jgi:radical SAM protein with 4Fe4S-binding SPASM domain
MAPVKERLGLDPAPRQVGIHRKMKKPYTSERPLPQLPLWRRLKEKRIPLSFELELTARCNNDCRHCYINRPADDPQARQIELTPARIADIADQAVELGSLWCLLTGGEPLLRDDFEEIYLMLRKKGLLVSVFTNACLIQDEHVELFLKHPPREMEVTVYGVTPEAYEVVTRRADSYAAFRRGLSRLLDHGIKVRLKAMALRSNVHELRDIAAFCRAHTKDYFRFDPLLHLRFDRDDQCNLDIIRERLSPGEIVALEQADRDRSDALKRQCDQYLLSASDHKDCRHLFHCGAGIKSFTVGSDGKFRLCSSLVHPDCVYDLETGSLADAWNAFVPKVRAMTSADPDYLAKCRSCGMIDLCLWCPAHAYLETGRLDAWVDAFCSVAHARAAALEPMAVAKPVLER